MVVIVVGYGAAECDRFCLLVAVIVDNYQDVDL